MDTRQAVRDLLYTLLLECAIPAPSDYTRMIRTRLGGGSPNTIKDEFDRYWPEFQKRLAGGLGITPEDPVPHDLVLPDEAMQGLWTALRSLKTQAIREARNEFTEGRKESERIAQEARLGIEAAMLQATEAGDALAKAADESGKRLARIGELESALEVASSEASQLRGEKRLLGAELMQVKNQADTDRERDKSDRQYFMQQLDDTRGEARRLTAILERTEKSLSAEQHMANEMRPQLASARSALSGSRAEAAAMREALREIKAQRDAELKDAEGRLEALRAVGMTEQNRLAGELAAAREDAARMGGEIESSRLQNAALLEAIRQYPVAGGGKHD